MFTRPPLEADERISAFHLRTAVSYKDHEDHTNTPAVVKLDGPFYQRSHCLRHNLKVGILVWFVVNISFERTSGVGKTT